MIPTQIYADEKSQAIEGTQTSDSSSGEVKGSVKKDAGNWSVPFRELGRFRTMLIGPGELGGEGRADAPLVDYTQLRALVPVPLLKDKVFLVNILEYDSTHFIFSEKFRIKDGNPPVSLFAPSWDIGVVSIYNSNWKFTIMAGVGYFSDFKEFSGSAFRGRGGLTASYDNHDNLKVNFGLMLVKPGSKTFPIPFAIVNWAITKQLALKVIMPGELNLRYAPDKTAILGFKIKYHSKKYRISASEGKQPSFEGGVYRGKLDAYNLTFAYAQAGPEFFFRIWKPLFLKLGSGISYMMPCEIPQSEDELPKQQSARLTYTPDKIDIGSRLSWYFETGLYFMY